MTIRGGTGEEIVIGADEPQQLPPPARCTHYIYGGNVGWLALPSNAEPGAIAQVEDVLMERLRELAYRDYASVLRPETFHLCYRIGDICNVYLMQVERMPGAEVSD